MPHVVILGAGYAGLMAALGLSRRVPGRVVLINEREEFVERIRLQESIAREVAERLPSLPAFLAGTGIEFVRGRVLSLDAGSLRVVVDHGKDVSEITFDRCIYALGSTTRRGCRAGRQRTCLPPRSRPRRSGSAAALRAKLRGEAREGLSVVVVGGANTAATEVAGEIKATWPEVEVTIVSTSEAGDFGKGKQLALMTRRELQRLGVRMLDRQLVAEVRAGEVITSKGETIPADICVWAAGFAPHRSPKRPDWSSTGKAACWPIRCLARCHIPTS